MQTSSSTTEGTADLWPALPFQEWKETYATLHMWTQIVGKIRLVQTPWVNHSWHTPLYVTSRGLTTSPIGEIPLSFTWPSGVPSGTPVVLQYAIQDPLAVKGVALSNGLKGTTP